MPQSRVQSGIAQRQSILRGRERGKKTVLSRLPGALARALLVILLITLPNTMTLVTDPDNVFVVMVVAMFAAAFMVAEYSTASPSLLEFRDAPPFNRIRFAALFSAVILMAAILSANPMYSTLHVAIEAAGQRLGHLADFPYSPVRLFLLTLPEDAPLSQFDNLRTAAGLSYVISLVSVAVFIVVMRGNAWPRRTQTFNFWVNLPTFDPTAGGDVVDRLNRDSTVNLVLGFLLPFLIPAALKASQAFMDPFDFGDPQTLIWTVALWAFLPSSLLMRGIALNRVAQMIHVQRKKAYAAAAAEGMLPV